MTARPDGCVGSLGPATGCQVQRSRGEEDTHLSVLLCGCPEAAGGHCGKLDEPPLVWCSSYVWAFLTFQSHALPWLDFCVALQADSLLRLLSAVLCLQVGQCRMQRGGLRRPSFLEARGIAESSASQPVLAPVQSWQRPMKPSTAEVVSALDVLLDVVLCPVLKRLKGSLKGSSPFLDSPHCRMSRKTFQEDVSKPSGLPSVVSWRWLTGPAVLAALPLIL